MYPFRGVEDALLENDDEGVPTANGSATREGYLQRAPSTRRNYLFLGISSTLRPLYSILAVFSVGFFVLNLYLFKRNVDLLLKYHEKFGFLHATTVSSIITGIKPFINMFFISFFALRVGVWKMSTVDSL
ncbi:hypothetical protein AAVH_01876 [Aphelenchoides avenae]|nr:hypothetical protein AAVH_01876 [Aphelenchus avenae]